MIVIHFIHLFFWITSLAPTGQSFQKNVEFYRDCCGQKSLSLSL